MKDYVLRGDPTGPKTEVRRYGYHRPDGELVRDDWIIACNKPGAVGPFELTRTVVRGAWTVDPADPYPDHGDRPAPSSTARAFLLAAAAAVAPDDVPRAAFADLIDRADADGASEQDVWLTLLDAMSDGLRHGNWPGRSL